MSETEKILKVITNFVKGGDYSDIAMLEKVMHSNFRVTNNGYMGNPGVFIISRQEYLSNINNGLFGGTPRKIRIEAIDVSGRIAMVKLRLESAENHFLSYNSLVLDSDNEWKIIENLAIVDAKNA